MHAKEVIERMGGVKSVMKITGLTKVRVYQFIQQNHIPKSWLMFFHEKDKTIPLTLSAK